MRSGGRRGARRRGATYTFLTIVFSMLLLGSATIFMGASVHAYQLAALHTRRAALREAAFGGLRWACSDVALVGSGTSEGAGTLQLTGDVQVAVRWRRVALGADDVVATADVAGVEGLHVTATLVRRGDALQIDEAHVEAPQR